LSAEVDFYNKDDYFAPDIEKAQDLIQRDDYSSLMPEAMLTCF